MFVLVTCKSEEDRIKTEGARVLTTFLPLSVYGDVTCKNEENPIKNEGARVFTTLSPLQPYWSYMLSWKPEFCSGLAKI